VVGGPFQIDLVPEEYDQAPHFGFRVRHRDEHAKKTVEEPTWRRAELEAMYGAGSYQQLEAARRLEELEAKRAWGRREILGPFTSPKEKVVFPPPYYKANHKPKAEVKGTPFMQGTRVYCRLRDGADERAGTIVGGTQLLGDLHSKYTGYAGFLVCLDQPLQSRDRARCRESEPFLGYCHGAAVATRRIRTMDDRNEREVWRGFPDHLGMAVTDPEKNVDNVDFRYLDYGRILYTQDQGRSVLIHWLSSDRLLEEYSARFHSRESFGRYWDSCWFVPRSMLGFCALPMGSGGPPELWPADGSAALRSELPHKEGDYLIYRHSQSVNVDGVRRPEGGRRRYFVDKGTVLKVVAPDSKRGQYHVVVVGGCNSELVGHELRVNASAVEKLPFTWVPAGKTIEVVQEVVFKKTSLQGRKARVLVPTDGDGDLGVQFVDNLGAGSLDGAGKNGHCLYISAEAVKVSD